MNFNIRVVRQGDSYGLNDCLIHEGVTPLLEFYDRDYLGPDFTPLGQFVSRYRIDTLLDHSGGLALSGSVPKWRISSSEMDSIREALKAVDDYASAVDCAEEWVWQYALNRDAALKQHDSKMDEYELNPDKVTY